MDINVPLLRHQMDLVSDITSPFIGLIGGFGSGKTRALATKILYNGILNAPLMTMVIEPTYPMVKQNLVPTFEGILKDLGWWRHCRYNKSDHDLTVNVPGGLSFVVAMRSADNPDSLAGANLATVGLDEPSQIDDQAYVQACARARVDIVDGRKTVCQVIATGTPDEMIGWFYENYDQNPVPGTRIIRAMTTDNPFLPENFVTVRLAHYDEAERERYIRGLFVPPQGRVYGHFKRDIHVDNVDDVTPGDRAWMSCDFNVGSMEWLMGYVRGPKGREQVVVTHELVRENTDTMEQAEEASGMWMDIFRETDPHVRPSALKEIETYCDASGASRGSGRAGGASKSDTHALVAAGFKYPNHPRANPRVKDRVFSVNKLFRERLPDGEPRILIDPRCTKLIKALSAQGYGKDGAPDKTKGLDGILDAFGYRIHREWPASAPRGNQINWSRI